MAKPTLQLTTLIIIVVVIVTSFVHGDPICPGIESNTRRCSQIMLSSKVPKPSTCQRNMFANIEYDRFGQGRTDATGCYVTRVDIVEPVQAFFRVYNYFGCDAAGDRNECKQCFDEAVQDLERGCSGRAGGAVSLGKCCLSYHGGDTHLPYHEEDVSRHRWTHFRPFGHSDNNRYRDFFPLSSDSHRGKQPLPGGHLRGRPLDDGLVGGDFVGGGWVGDGTCSFWSASHQTGNLLRRRGPMPRRKPAGCASAMKNLDCQLWRDKFCFSCFRCRSSMRRAARSAVKVPIADVCLLLLATFRHVYADWKGKIPLPPCPTTTIATDN
ncbi:hypothetical protein LINGRAHAP2_LOCUS26738 [Linum grandiflorum]